MKAPLAISFFLSFIMQAPSHILTFMSPFHFQGKSHRFWLVVLLDSLKYSCQPVAIVQYGIITYIRCIYTADYYHQCGRHNARNTSNITHDLNCVVTRLTNKAVSP